MHKIKGYKDEWRVQEYLLITFFISWLSWGILVTLSALGIARLNSIVGMILFVIGGFGPTISAVLCLEGKLSLHKVLNFIFNHKKKTVGFLLLFAVLMIAITGLSSLEINPEMPWYALPVVFIVCTLFGGGNEELGWRGTLQPVLERTMSKRIKNPVVSFIVTTLIVGIIWAVWHLPLWFVTGSSQQGMNFGLFAIDAICVAFWLACIYRRTGSVFYCMIFHGLTNVLMSFFVIKVNWVLLLGYLTLTVLAVVLAGRAKPVHLPTEE